MRFASLLAAFATALVVGAVPAHAADPYPTRPVSLVVPYAPGGVTDVIARLFAAKLGARLNQSFIVENKAGAGGTIGTDYVARAKPDGYTLVMMIDTNTIAPALYAKLNSDPIRDFTPITLLATGPHIIVAHPSFGPSTMKELIDYAKAHPGEPYASSGNGTGQNLGMEEIKLKAGIDLRHVPYKGGGQAINDVVGGQVKVAVLGLAPVLPFLKSGQLKAIALTGEKRVPVLPNLATVGETLPGFATLQWFAVLAPAGTPADVVRAARRVRAGRARSRGRAAHHGHRPGGAHQRDPGRPAQVHGGRPAEVAAAGEGRRHQDRVTMGALDTGAMRLDADETAMLNGERGAAAQEALRFQIEVGRFFDAKRFVRITNAHLMGDIEVMGDGGLGLLRRLAEQKAECVVPTSTNARCMHFADVDALRQDEGEIAKEREIVMHLRDMRAATTDTCINYQTVYQPKLGEHVAWGDTGTVIYANSVFGARTNYEGGMASFAAAITGRTPAYGFHLDEVRRGSIPVEVRARLADSADWGALGKIVGHPNQDYFAVPVFTGIDEMPSSDALKHLGASLASYGSLAMYHVVGITPEAPTAEQAFADRERAAPTVVSQADIDAVFAAYRFVEGAHNVVVFSGPQLSLFEMQQLARLFAGRRVAPDMQAFATTNHARSAEDRVAGVVGGDVVRTLPAVDLVEVHELPRFGVVDLDVGVNGRQVISQVHGDRIGLGQVREVEQVLAGLCLAQGVHRRQRLGVENVVGGGAGADERVGPRAGDEGGIARAADEGIGGGIGDEVVVTRAADDGRDRRRLPGRCGMNGRDAEAGQGGVAGQIDGHRIDLRQPGKIERGRPHAGRDRVHDRRFDGSRDGTEGEGRPPPAAEQRVGTRPGRDRRGSGD